MESTLGSTAFTSVQALAVISHGKGSNKKRYEKCLSSGFSCKACWPTFEKELLVSHACSAKMHASRRRDINFHAHSDAHRKGPRKVL